MDAIITAALTCAAAGHAFHDVRWFVAALCLAAFRFVWSDI